MKVEQYVKMHQSSFRAAFDFLNAHFPPGPDPEWWEKTAKDANEVSILNKENKLVVELLGGVINYLEYEWKERRKNIETED